MFQRYYLHCFFEGLVLYDVELMDLILVGVPLLVIASFVGELQRLLRLRTLGIRRKCGLAGVCVFGHCAIAVNEMMNLKEM
jgi:hypothetical protein